jgi:dihydroflavonol-4-reductase
LARGASVRVLTRSTSDPRPLSGLDLERATGDVCDAASLNAACAGVDVVIHCAGHVHIGWSQQEQHEAINVGGTRNVVAAAERAGAKMVHVSSVNALGLGTLAAPAAEDNPLPGIICCHYAVSKRRGDEIVLEAVGRGLQAVIVHPGYMLGPWDWKPSSGRMLLEVAKFAPLAPIGAHCMGDARDVAAGVIAAAAANESGRRYILGGHNITYLESWRVMARLTGGRPPLFRAGPINRWIGGWWGDARFRRTGKEPDINSAAIGMSSQQHCFTSARAEKELGYKTRPLEESIRDAWQWFLEHGYAKKG